MEITDNDLDDNCAADALGSVQLKRYYEKYREIAEKSAVSLAGEENKAKGLNYDTRYWKCWIPREKSTRLIREPYGILEEGGTSNGGWMRVSGKINHYHPLLLNGKFNRALIQHAVKQEQKQEVRIELKPETRIQVIWWILNGRERPGQSLVTLIRRLEG